MKLPKVSAVIAAAVLAPAVLFPSSASAADKPQPTGVSGPDTASDAASDAAGDHTAGGHTAGDQEQRDRAEVERILADKEIGPGVREAGEKALKGGAAELRHFLAVELDKQRGDDNRVKVSRILAAATGRAVKEAANRAMSGTDEDVVKFLKEGQFTARAEDDDRAEVERILADKEIGPGVREAGEKALKGGAAE
ncbi:ALF repeat-containing protein, partial [Kitasatospora aureofaciens]|uniref:ALF repeat-containing protein n=1 Tax=Kitasatospora aureofaciens TaxID=1894 RepID=UPI00381CF4D7